MKSWEWCKCRILLCQGKYVGLEKAWERHHGWSELCDSSCLNRWCVQLGEALEEKEYNIPKRMEQNVIVQCLLQFRHQDAHLETQTVSWKYAKSRIFIKFVKKTYISATGCNESLRQSSGQSLSCSYSLPRQTLAPVWPCMAMCLSPSQVFCLSCGWDIA